MTEPTEPTEPEIERLDWLRSHVESFPNVRSASISTDQHGRLFVDVSLASSGGDDSTASETERSGLDSLVDADVAAIVVFDSETLEIVQASASAGYLLGLDPERQNLTIADLYAQNELERLGSALVDAQDGWVDLGSWAMLSAGNAEPVRCRNWHGPADGTKQRLLIATAEL